jgi:hypothetical protein
MLVQGIASRGVQLWLVENTETGKRLFVTRAEYITMFGEEPSSVAPALPAAPPEAETPAAPAQEGDAFDKFMRSMERHGGRRAPSRGSVPPPSPDDPNRFVPAAPKMDVSPGSVTMLQEIPTQRPVITEADRGKWRVLEYVSSGDGPFVFKTGTMLRYGLARATVNNDEELKTFLGGKRILRLEPTWSEGLVAFLTLFSVRGLLIAVFLIALFVEMTHPGLVLPGAIAAAALIALLAPPMLINLASWWEVGAIGAGMVLLALEMFVIPGFGVAGVLGVVLLFGGLIGTFVPSGAIFDPSGAHRADLLYGMTTMVLALASVGVFVYFFARHFQSLPLLNRLILKDATVADDGGEPMLAAMAAERPGLRAGMSGVAITNLRPAGQVEVGGELHDVVADLGYIPAGAPVRITSVTPFRIGVEQAGP